MRLTAAEAERVREGADSVWLLPLGDHVSEVVKITGLSRRTVERARRRWSAEGLDGLFEDRQDRPASELQIRLLFLPGDSPHLNLIERLWKFINRTPLRGRCYETFAAFQTAVEGCLTELPTTHRPRLTRLMTLNSQTFANASVLAG